MVASHLGMRGLKYHRYCLFLFLTLGRIPLRDAWIEIFHNMMSSLGTFSRIPLRDAWIEIKCVFPSAVCMLVASHLGMRGLKSCIFNDLLRVNMSHPT